MINRNNIIPSIEQLAIKEGSLRVSDVASKCYLTRQTARRILNQMVKDGKLICTKIRYVGNADICVYKKL